MEPKLTTLLLNISLGFFFFRFRFICLFVFFFPSKISGILFICICFCVPNAQLIDSYFEMVYWFAYCSIHIKRFKQKNKKEEFIVPRCELRVSQRSYSINDNVRCGHICRSRKFACKSFVRDGQGLVWGDRVGFWNSIYVEFEIHEVCIYNRFSRKLVINSSFRR